MRLQIASDVESPINRKEPHVKTIRWAALAAVLVALLATGCTHRPGEPLTRSGDEIIVAGQLFHTGTRVITFLDPEGYNAYRAYRHFNNAETMPSNPVDKGNPNRYSPTRRNLDPALQETVDKDGWTLENLRKQVDQFVIHYDVCGTAQQCFYILHDYRGLSVHFMLDLDGTVYQTLDLRERPGTGTTPTTARWASRSPTRVPMASRRRSRSGTGSTGPGRCWISSASATAKCTPAITCPSRPARS